MQLFLSDPETKFSKSIGWNLGERTARYALIIDHGKVVYAEKEPGRDVTVSSQIFDLSTSRYDDPACFIPKSFSLACLFLGDWHFVCPPILHWAITEETTTFVPLNHETLYGGNIC